MRRILVVTVLLITLAAVFTAGRASYDRGYSEGFETGAAEVATATEQLPDGGSVQVITTPARDRFGPGPGFGFFFLVFPLTFLLLVALAGRRRVSGACGPGGTRGPWGDPESTMQSWHERVHAGAGTGPSSTDAKEEAAWPDERDRSTER